MSRSAELEGEMRDLKIARSDMQEAFSRMKEAKEAADRRVEELTFEVLKLRREMDARDGRRLRSATRGLPRDPNHR